METVLLRSKFQALFTTYDTQTRGREVYHEHVAGLKSDLAAFLATPEDKDARQRALRWVQSDDATLHCQRLCSYSQTPDRDMYTQ